MSLATAGLHYNIKVRLQGGLSLFVVHATFLIKRPERPLWPMSHNQIPKK